MNLVQPSKLSWMSWAMLAVGAYGLYREKKSAWKFVWGGIGVAGALSAIGESSKPISGCNTCTPPNW